MSVKVIGIDIDIAKSVFQIHGIDEQSAIVLKKRRTRATFLAELSQHPACLIGLEVGSGAHHWARCLVEFGHKVRLMPPQYVRPLCQRKQT